MTIISGKWCCYSATPPQTVNIRVCESEATLAHTSLSRSYTFNFVTYLLRRTGQINGVARERRSLAPRLITSATRLHSPRLHRAVIAGGTRVPLHTVGCGDGGDHITLCDVSDDEKRPNTNEAVHFDVWSVRSGLHHRAPHIFVMVRGPQILQFNRCSVTSTTSVVATTHETKWERLAWI